MPTYDYECSACGHTFDAFQSMSDDPLSRCPSCGKAKLKRLIGGGLGVIFKGSGFYVTDSRSSGSAAKTAPKSDGESAASDKTGGDGKKSADTGGGEKTSGDKKATSSSTKAAG